MDMLQNLFKLEKFMSHIKCNPGHVPDSEIDSLGHYISSLLWNEMTGNAKDSHFCYWSNVRSACERVKEIIEYKLIYGVETTPPEKPEIIISPYINDFAPTKEDRQNFLRKLAKLRPIAVRTRRKVPTLDYSVYPKFVTILDTAKAADYDFRLAGGYQHAINQFLDDFRYAPPSKRPGLISTAPEVRDGRLAAILAGVVHALCDETGCPFPSWLSTIGLRSPTVFCVMRPDGPYTDEYLAREREDTPFWFLIRDIYVPSNYLNRA